MTLMNAIVDELIRNYCFLLLMCDSVTTLIGSDDSKVKAPPRLHLILLTSTNNICLPISMLRSNPKPAPSTQHRTLERSNHKDSRRPFATMGHVANGDNIQEEILSQQTDLYDLDFFMVPTTPDNTPEDVMTNVSETFFSHETGATDTVLTPTDHNGADRRNTNNENNGAEDGSDVADTEFATDDNDNPYASFDPNTILLISITNPSAFPIQRLQEVQSQRQPSTHVTDMWCHKTPSGPITQVTADLQDGSINHLFIRDERWISALGLAAPDFDTIQFDATKLRLDETFTIRVFPGQRTRKLEEWIMGELVGARHAYLYWLDERQCADPRCAPYAAEAKAIARKTGRRWPDVMREIEQVWTLEQGGDGREYKENRAKYLGEDPRYPAGAEERSILRSMFG